MGTGFAHISILEVAHKLLGKEGPRSTAREKHFPDHGGLFVNPEKGVWRSHLNEEGGDVVNLIRHVKGCDFMRAQSWLEAEGYRRAPNGRSNGHGPRRLVCTYDYCSENGEAAYHVDRYDDKTFRQWRTIDGERVNGIVAGTYERSAKGEWYRLNGKGPRPGQPTREFPAIESVPYRLPELSKSVGTVLVPGGEKDVDNLRALGFIATTNHGGEGKWQPSLSRWLKGRRVHILCDNDPAGEKHQEVVGAALRGFTDDIHVIRFPELPASGDVSDWIDKRKSEGASQKQIAEELKQRCREAPAWAVPIAKEEDNALIALNAQWPVMADEALYGLAGDVVRTISPHSEADSVAILLQFLACVGNLIGHSHYYLVECSRHYANLYEVLVGQSSKARKGTSYGRVISVAKIADELWAADRTKGGLSSGEGLINEVRDEVKKWDAKAQTYDVVDPGASDKRLTIVEPEFAGALAVMERHGNTLSPVIRKGWDGDKLSTMTRNSPLTATNAHLSIIAHITETELRARLTRTDTANGFANRFLFALVKRSKLLPFGGDLSDSEILELGRRLKEVLAKLPLHPRITMTDAAKEAWATIYGELSADRPGLLGAVTARAEAQTIRLAMIYALLDGCGQIDLPHLKAGLAVWEYCEESAAHIFEAMLGDPVADDILRALKNAGGDGLTRTNIRSLFSGHQSSDSISNALATLLAKGLVWMENKETGGRPVEAWYAQKAQ